MNAVQIGTFDTLYAKLPERFFARVRPISVAAPRLIALNQALADAFNEWLGCVPGNSEKGKTRA